MTERGFICKRCGKCCLHASFSEVAEADVDLWKSLGRGDLLQWVRFRPIGQGEHAYEVWIDPATGTEVEGCPWLRRRLHRGPYVCTIHDVRPTVCRYFPASRKHAEEIGCEGFQDG